MLLGHVEPGVLELGFEFRRPRFHVLHVHGVALVGVDQPGKFGCPLLSFGEGLHLRLD